MNPNFSTWGNGTNDQFIELLQDSSTRILQSSDSMSLPSSQYLSPLDLGEASFSNLPPCFGSEMHPADPVVQLARTPCNQIVSEVSHSIESILAYENWTSQVQTELQPGLRLGEVDKISSCHTRLGQASGCCDYCDSLGTKYKGSMETTSEDDGQLENSKVEKRLTVSSSKHLGRQKFRYLTERKRRNRINEKMEGLQKLLPRKDKRDKVGILDDAAEYIKSLQLQLQAMPMQNTLYSSLLVSPPTRHLQEFPYFWPVWQKIHQGICFGNITNSICNCFPTFQPCLGHSCAGPSSEPRMKDLSPQQTSAIYASPHMATNFSSGLLNPSENRQMGLPIEPEQGTSRGRCSTAKGKEPCTDSSVAEHN